MQTIKEGQICSDQSNLDRMKIVSDWIDEATWYLLEHGVPSAIAFQIELAAKMLIRSFYVSQWRDPVGQARSTARFLEDFAQTLRQLASDEEASQR